MEFFFVFLRFLFVLKSKNNRQPRAADSAKIAGRTAERKMAAVVFCSPQNFLVFSIFVSSKGVTG